MHTFAFCHGIFRARVSVCVCMCFVVDTQFYLDTLKFPQKIEDVLLQLFPLRT